MLTSGELKELLHYNQDTGVFTWLKAVKCHPYLINSRAGCVTLNKCKRYETIRIKGQGYKSHRLAWLYVHGSFPLMSIDHINGDSLDNRIVNLRDCCHLKNNQNHLKRKNNSGLPCGVRILTSGRYQARITVNKNIIYLGTFSSSTKAGSAYVNARLSLHDAPALKEIIL